MENTFEWNQRRTKGIVEFYGYKFFYFKRVLDLGCGYGDLGGVVYRLGSDVTAVDARQEHLKIVGKKYSGIKTVQSNLDANWPFHGQRFDVIFDLALMCHLADFEAHLKAVCASCTHLVLETAVCDSDDPRKCIVIDEDKGTYDLSYSGKGCRPSPAAIERVLKECGMNFKRMDNAKFNTDHYKYDWYPQNDNSTSLEKRRIWFCVKESSPIQFQNPNSEIATPPMVIYPGPGYTTPIINSGIPAASPKPPMSARIEAEARARSNNATPVYNGPPASAPSPIQVVQGIEDPVRYDSKRFAIIGNDVYTPSISSSISGVIAVNTYSSKMWFKKVSPLFPNLKLSANVLSMPDFTKHEATPDIIMCSINNLQSYKRVWIDEWFGNALTEAHLTVLKGCHAIITPSLLNAQEIWKHIPHANVFRVDKPWPLVDVTPAEGDFFLYMEKSSKLTRLLIDSWEARYGTLVVVGSSVKLPSFATFVSDAEPYTQVVKLIRGAKAIIDLSENNYYASGVQKLVTAIGAPLLTNNHNKLGQGVTIIQQDKNLSPYPNTAHVKQAIDKFLSGPYPRSQNVIAHNMSVEEDVKRILGV